MGKTQNTNELQNNIIWTYIPKRIFFKLNTLKFGVYLAMTTLKMMGNAI